MVPRVPTIAYVAPPLPGLGTPLLSSKKFPSVHLAVYVIKGEPQGCHVKDEPDDGGDKYKCQDSATASEVLSYPMHPWGLLAARARLCFSAGAAPCAWLTAACVAFLGDAMLAFLLLRFAALSDGTLRLPIALCAALRQLHGSSQYGEVAAGQTCPLLSTSSLLFFSLLLVLKLEKQPHMRKLCE